MVEITKAFDDCRVPDDKLKMERFWFTRLLIANTKIAGMERLLEEPSLHTDQIKMITAQLKLFKDDRDIAQKYLK